MSNPLYSDKNVAPSKTTGAVVILLSTALFFRLYNLGVESLWNDEAFTWWRIQLSWKDMFTSLRNPGGLLPAYYVAEKLIVTCIGSTEEWSLRLFSGLTGVLTILFSMKIGQETGGKIGMLAAGWFWVFHPMAIWYSRDSKPYSLAAAFAAGLVLVYLLLWKRNKKIYLYLALSFMTLGLLTHYYFFALNGALILVTVTKINNRRGLFRNWTVFSLIASVPLGIWLLWFFSQSEPFLGSGWIEKPDFYDALGTFWNLISGYAGTLSIPTTLFGSFSFAIILIGIFLNHSAFPLRNVLMFGLFIPILSLLVVSQYRPIFVDRYFIVFLPVVTILFSSGVESTWKGISNRFTSSKQSQLCQYTVVFILFIIGFANGLFSISAYQYQRENWRLLAQDLSTEFTISNKIWFQDQGTTIPFSYYFQDEFEPIISEEAPYCTTPCWWVLRQPFTYTHAFTQSINPSNRVWIPELPEGCERIKDFDYESGILLWQVDCK